MLLVLNTQLKYFDRYRMQDFQYFLTYIGEATTGMEHTRILDFTVSIIEGFLNEPVLIKN